MQSPNDARDVPNDARDVFVGHHVPQGSVRFAAPALTWIKFHLRRGKVTTKGDGEPWYPGDQRAQLTKGCTVNNGMYRGGAAITGSLKNRSADYY